MVRGIFVFIFVVCSFGAIAQRQQGLVYYPPPELGYRVPGLLSASATFTPAAMLNRKSNNYYLSGFAEYQLDNRLSLRSDNYFHMNGNGNPTFVHRGFRSYFGAFYHLNQSRVDNWDVKFGFQPGITFMRSYSYQDLMFPDASDWVVSPSFSLSVGFDYYVWKYFHFFTNLAYVNSTMRGLPTGAERTDELMFSAGLGFQIRTIKQRR